MVLLTGKLYVFSPQLRRSREVKNARREGDIFTFTSRVTYHCEPGYELVGRANRYCESRESGVEYCPLVDPSSAPNREMSPTAGLSTTTTYQSVARYECLNGYRLVGPEIRVCEANKQWEGEEPTAKVEQ
ncbi:protein lev-9 [Caerostris extrusa]|uniref:Protein lev-9 n=1 Tax=Caerostris extrusa TaxID=172846 RepID=A0AAV4WKS7_CAEEX|nr:protein lev-9 [Caerostris extrusa]